jgi:hypothetical protein
MKMPFDSTMPDLQINSMYTVIKALVASGCLLLPLMGLAQTTKVDTVYYGSKAQRLPSRAGASRYITTEAQPGGGVLQKIYALNGHQLEQIPYADAQATTREGLATSWFPTGELKGRRTYKAGQVDGQLLQFYTDGTLQRVEIYQKGGLKRQQCYTVNGQPSMCPPEKLVGKVFASYQYGQTGLTGEVKNRTHYPTLPEGETAQRGQVIVACMIGVDGRLRESRSYKSLGPLYDKEALRVVNSLKGMWSPQLVDDEPEESFYTVEVDFIPKVKPQ